MYAKLFSRITESSLMEEPIETRYVFLTLLAIADPRGHLIGTDVALARRINVPLDTFQDSVRRLMKPDPDSNSPVEQGRRLVPSDCGRGYRLVNYVAYRDTRDEEHRRNYMRQYMAQKRQGEATEAAIVNPGSSVSTCKQLLAQAEAEAEAEASPSLSAGAEPPAVDKSLPAHFPEIPSWPAVKACAARIGLPEWRAELWFNEMEGCGWQDKRQRRVCKWQSVLNTIKTYWEADGRPTQPNSYANPNKSPHGVPGKRGVADRNSGTYNKPTGQYHQFVRRQQQQEPMGPLAAP